MSIKKRRSRGQAKKTNNSEGVDAEIPEEPDEKDGELRHFHSQSSESVERENLDVEIVETVD